MTRNGGGDVMCVVANPIYEYEFRIQSQHVSFTT